MRFTAGGLHSHGRRTGTGGDPTGCCARSAPRRALSVCLLPLPHPPLFEQRRSRDEGRDEADAFPPLPSLASRAGCGDALPRLRGRSSGRGSGRSRRRRRGGVPLRSRGIPAAGARRSRSARPRRAVPGISRAPGGRRRRRHVVFWLGSRLASGLRAGGRAPAIGTSVLPGHGGRDAGGSPFGLLCLRLRRARRSRAGSGGEGRDRGRGRSLAGRRVPPCAGGVRILPLPLAAGSARARGGSAPALWIAVRRRALSLGSRLLRARPRTCFVAVARRFLAGPYCRDARETLGNGPNGVSL